MKLKVPQTVSNVDNFDDLKRFTDQYLTAIKDVLNGNVGFTDNLSVAIVQYSFSQPNVNYQITHTLGRIPTGYFLVQKNAACDVYDGGSSNTETLISLKATTATSVKVLVF